MSKTDYLYDLYILHTSGLPIISGCTATDYCRQHMEQHALHAGFFSALYTFSKESGVGKNLNNLNYDDIKISFKTDEKNGIMLVLVHPIHMKNKKIEKDLDAVYNLFMEKYYPRLEENQEDKELFQEFRKDLHEQNIVPNENMAPTAGMQMEKKKFFSRWFSHSDE